MPSALDFRKKPFALRNVKASGVYLGKTSYPRLYVIENVIRVIIHSVLSAQIGKDWWNSDVEEPIKRQVDRFKQDYLLRPWHSKPGKHDLYYAQLKYLGKIILSNKIHFEPIIPDIDKWVADIEGIRLPRNIVGHMNFPSEIDQKRIDIFFEDCQALIKQFAKSKLVPLKIP